MRPSLSHLSLISIHLAVASVGNRESCLVVACPSRRPLKLAAHNRSNPNMNTDTRLGFMDASLSIRDETQMSVIALFTWIATVLFGLLLLVFWLMESDREYQNEAAPRLPIPVISAHALLGMGGLLLWAIYLLADQERMAWATVA